MVNTKQKPLIDTQKKEFKHTFTECHQITREESKRRKRRGRGDYKTAKSESEVAQSGLTLCDPVDCSPPVSSVHGILQARMLEWVAIPFSGGVFKI